jgi:hypothetical protein
LVGSALLDEIEGSGILVIKYSTVFVLLTRFAEIPLSCSKSILIVELPFSENVGPARATATSDVDNKEIVTVPVKFSNAAFVVEIVKVLVIGALPGSEILTSKVLFLKSKAPSDSSTSKMSMEEAS